MTKQQIKQEMHQRLQEYFDGYVLIGKVAGDGEFISAVGMTDHLTLTRLRDSMARMILRMDQELRNGAV